MPLWLTSDVDEQVTMTGIFSVNERRVARLPLATVPISFPLGKGPGEALGIRCHSVIWWHVDMPEDAPARAFRLVVVAILAEVVVQVLAVGTECFPFGEIGGETIWV